MNAATISSNSILLNQFGAFPQRPGNDTVWAATCPSTITAQVTAIHRGAPKAYYYGRRPTSVMIPSFRNKTRQDAAFQGYMMFYSATRQGWTQQQEGATFSTDYINKMHNPALGPYMMMQGETVPQKTTAFTSNQKTVMGFQK